MTGDRAPLIFIVAGEPSGDVLGGRLMRGLRTLTGGAVRFDGIGGGRMVAEGLVSRAPLSALSLFGIVEVLPKAVGILRLVRETAAAAVAAGPAAIVTIDSSGFNFRLARRLRLLGYRGPLIHYVAPQLWAWWRPAKARSLTRYYDRLLALFPFEPAFFAQHGIAAEFVGHPAVEEGFGDGDGAAFRQRHDVPATAPILVVLPGSRRSEVRRLLPVFGEAVGRLAGEIPGLVAVVPTVPTVGDAVGAGVAHWPLRTIVLRDGGEKADAFAAATAAIAASGTVTLELALSGTPFVVGYLVNELTARVVGRYVRVRFATIANLVMDRAIVPELIQKACTADRVVEVTRPLLLDPMVRATTIADLKEAIGRLGFDGPPPSERAARAVLDLIGRTA